MKATNQQAVSVAKATAQGWTKFENTDLGSVLLRKGAMVMCIYFDGTAIQYKG